MCGLRCRQRAGFAGSRGRVGRNANEDDAVASTIGQTRDPAILEHRALRVSGFQYAELDVEKTCRYPGHSGDGCGLGVCPVRAANVGPVFRAQTVGGGVALVTPAYFDPCWRALKSRAA